MLIETEEGFIRWPWIEVDELARGASHHLKETLPMERGSCRFFTEGAVDFLRLNIHFYLH